MYHPLTIRARLAQAERAYKREFIEHSVADVKAWTARLSTVYNSDGKPVRGVSAEESAFIENEQIVTKFNYPYWASRYCVVNKQGDRDATDIMSPMFPLLETQEFILDKIAEAERKQFTQSDARGIRINILKAARQIGASTLSESIAAHRITTQNGIFGLIASDVPETSAYLFDMLERMIQNLPWWLRPAITEHVKNTEIVTDGGSNIWVGSGKSTRGTTGARGQLGRGKALSVIHLSELAQWETADQLEGSLFPTIPPHPRVIVLFETTAKGQGNWWQKHWSKSRKGLNDFIPVFIPWYIEKKRYSRVPPDGWEPLPTSISHARRCEETSIQWVGHRISLTRDQLYWYETKRAEFEADGNMRTFLEDYGAIDDIECFQAAGRSVFGPELLQKVRDFQRPLIGAAEIMPKRELQ